MPRCRTKCEPSNADYWAPYVTTPAVDASSLRADLIARLRADHVGVSYHEAWDSLKVRHVWAESAGCGDAGRGACRWWIGTRPTGTTSSPSTRSGLTPRRRSATPLAGTASTCGLNPTASSLMAPTLVTSTRCEPRIGTLTARATTWCVAVAPWLMCCCRRRRACTSPTVLAAPVLWRLLGSRRRMHLSRTRRSRRVHRQERRHVPAACFCAG